MLNRNNSEWILSIVLLVAGIVSILASVADLFGWNISLIPSGKDLSAVILGLLGIVSTVLAVERVIQFRQFERNFDKLETLLTRSSGGQQLVGYNEIYEAGTRLVNSAKSHIRALVFSSGPKAPDYFVSAMTSRMKQLKRIGNLLSYEIVLAMNMDSIPPNFREAVESRNIVYDRAGVGDLVSLNVIDVKPPIDFDVLIVDDEHVIISFPTLSDVPHVQSGVIFENQPQLAKEFSEWYDKRILRGAISYNEWLKKNE